MYVIEVYDNLTDEQIDDAVENLRGQMLAKRTLVMVVDREKNDAVNLGGHPERDQAQIEAICKALNDAG